VDFDFTRLVLYAPDTLEALVAFYNRISWPAQPIAVLVAAVLVILLAIARRRGAPAALLVLAGFWAWVSLSWFTQIYGGINWMGRHYAIGFGVQAFLLVVAAVLARRQSAGTVRAADRRWLVLAGAVLILHPLASWLLGLPPAALRTVGIHPDPTVVFTLCLLFAMHAARWWLMAVPVLWLLISTGWSILLGAPGLAVLPGLGLVLVLAGIALAVFRRRSAGA